jgi:hypothetical protein
MKKLIILLLLTGSFPGLSSGSVCLSKYYHNDHPDTEYVCASEANSVAKCELITAAFGQQLVKLDENFFHMTYSYFYGEIWRYPTCESLVESLTPKTKPKRKKK